MLERLHRYMLAHPYTHAENKEHVSVIVLKSGGADLAADAADFADFLLWELLQGSSDLVRISTEVFSFPEHFARAVVWTIIEFNTSV